MNAFNGVLTYVLGIWKNVPLMFLFLNAKVIKGVTYVRKS